jgi:hypothetical protein
MKTLIMIRPNTRVTGSMHARDPLALKVTGLKQILMGLVLAVAVMAPHRTLATAPTVNNTNGATSVLSISAVLNGTLTSTGGVPTQVYVYWGETDGGTNFGNWGNTNNLGTNAVGPLSLTVTNLWPNRMYYYRFYATNSTGAAWANATTNFTTLAAAYPAPINLNSCSNFAILAYSTVTTTGGGIINGDVGLSPAGSQEIPPVQINGNIYNGGPIAAQAQLDLTAAYGDAAGRSVNQITLTDGENIGGLTLAPGLYWSASSLYITGNLTLDAGGDPNAVWIFQMGTTLITAAGAPGNPASQIILAGGAQAKNIFWQVGSSATLGTYSVFQGTIMAQGSITMNTDSIMDGRALARTGAVTYNGSSGSLPLWPEAPIFTHISRTTTNSVTVVISATPNFLLTLQTSTNLSLTNWTTIATNTPITSPWTNIDDTATASVTQRFYRAFITY